MNTEIPEFLLEMSKQIRYQDNRCTAEPIYQVRCQRYVVTEEGYNESHWELHAPDSDGRPIYSTLSGFINDDYHSEFYEENEDWCNFELVEAGFDPTLESFIDNFDFYEYKNDCNDWPYDYKVIHMQETEEVVKTCLTESDAEWFIKRKQHDYPKLYTYVESMVFCPQMIELRNWILSLSEPLNEIKQDKDNE